MAVKTQKVPERKSLDVDGERLEGVVIGMLGGFDTQGFPLVIFPGNPGEMPVAAKTMATCAPHDIGREVALLFECGDPQKPLLVGLIQNPSNTTESHQTSQRELAAVEAKAHDSPTLELDGERVELKARQEIILKCGKASITLTKAGKILVRGTYLSSCSTGVNRIKGGSIQLN